MDCSLLQRLASRGIRLQAESPQIETTRRASEPAETVSATTQKPTSDLVQVVCDRAAASSADMPRAAWTGTPRPISCRAHVSIREETSAKARLVSKPAVLDPLSNSFDKECSFRISRRTHIVAESDAYEERLPVDTHPHVGTEQSLRRMRCGLAEREIEASSSAASAGSSKNSSVATVPMSEEVQQMPKVYPPVVSPTDHPSVSSTACVMDTHQCLSLQSRRPPTKTIDSVRASDNLTSRRTSGVRGQDACVEGAVILAEVGQMDLLGGASPANTAIVSPATAPSPARKRPSCELRCRISSKRPHVARDAVKVPLGKQVASFCEDSEPPWRSGERAQLTSDEAAAIQTLLQSAVATLYCPPECLADDMTGVDQQGPWPRRNSGASARDYGAFLSPAGSEARSVSLEKRSGPDAAVVRPAMSKDMVMTDEAGSVHLSSFGWLPTPSRGVSLSAELSDSAGTSAASTGHKRRRTSRTSPTPTQRDTSLGSAKAVADTDVATTTEEPLRRRSSKGPRVSHPASWRPRTNSADGSAQPTTPTPAHVKSSGESNKISSGGISPEPAVSILSTTLEKKELAVTPPKSTEQEANESVTASPRGSPMTSGVFRNDAPVMCGLCCEDADPGSAVRLACQHGWYCSICMTRHVEARLSDGVVEVSCPECRVPLAEHTLRAAGVPDKTLDRLNALSLEQAVNAASDLWACPTPNCPMRVALEEGERAQLRCTMCKKSSCLKCGAQPFHRGKTCEQHAEKQRSLRRQTMGFGGLRQWMEETGSKQCPTCHMVVTKQNLKNQLTQKAECHKMCCRVCKTRFCFKCLAILTGSFTCGCTSNDHGFIDPTSGTRLNHLRKGRGGSQSRGRGGGSSRGTGRKGQG
mmetsp:Transcript_50833/g.135680  ORF Transcript_50833/g.135680 Transcript_50833/m.135680 type:complete len:869 (-) Transcript_50833:23-2629(-)